MERLTERKMDYCQLMDCGITCTQKELCDDAAIYNKLRAYEDAEEQGLLVRLPCKVGEIVWIAHPKYNRVHRGMFPCVSFIMAEIENGCIICKTKEEAEAKLAKDTNVPNKEG